MFPKNGNLETSALRVQRIQAMADTIISPGENSEKNYYQTNRDLLITQAPNVWNIWVLGNMEQVLEVEFAKFGVAVTGQTGQDLNKITAFTFFASVEHLKEKNKPTNGVTTV